MQVTELPSAPCPLLPRPPLESCPTSLPTTAIMSATSSASGYIVYCILSHQLGAMQTIYLLSCPIVISCFSLVWVMVSWCWKNRSQTYFVRHILLKSECLKLATPMPRWVRTAVVIAMVVTEIGSVTWHVTCDMWHGDHYSYLWCSSTPASHQSYI